MAENIKAMQLSLVDLAVVLLQIEAHALLSECLGVITGDCSIKIRGGPMCHYKKSIKHKRNAVYVRLHIIIMVTQTCRLIV